MIETIPLDPPTLRACALIARQSADGIPHKRAHYTVAADALRVLADTFDELAMEKGTA